MSNFLYDSISKIITLRRQYARQAEQLYAKECKEIIQTKCCDKHRIEKLLDAVLDFYFDEEVLNLYKKLCSYYYQIDAVAAVEYVYAYRDMWDER